MDASFYLVLKSRRAKYTANNLEFAGGRVIQKKPESLARDEISIKLDMTIPDSLFRRPTLTASIEIPEPETEFTLSPDVRQQLTEQLRETLGINIDVAMAPDPEE